eukprot:1525138-Pleurochrysis_carterae.AAC.1
MAALGGNVVRRVVWVIVPEFRPFSLVHQGEPCGRLRHEFLNVGASGRWVEACDALVRSGASKRSQRWNTLRPRAARAASKQI